MTQIPESLKRELHPRCNRELAASILKFVDSSPAVGIHEVARGVGCSNLTALKYLVRMVQAGLACEKRVGRVRIFLTRTQIFLEDGKHDGT